MNTLSFVIITSLVFIALINFGLPVYYKATKDAEVKDFIESSSSRNTIFLSLILPLFIGLSIYKAVDVQWVNSVIAFIGNIFPMEDYPVIHSESRIYSPEHSFLQTFTLVSEIAYTVVGITSLYALVKDSIKRAKNQ